MKQVLLVLTILVMVTGLAAQFLWGDNSLGQCDVPATYDFDLVSPGASHSIGLTSDDRIVAWGDNSLGQCDLPEGYYYRFISTKANFNIALRWGGSLVAWGENDCGQCNVPAGNDFIYISAGVKHGLAVRSDGSIVSWGDSTNGLGNVPRGNRFFWVAAGDGFSLAIGHDGSLVAWGLLTDGLDAIPVGTDFRSIAVGWRHALALRTDGTLAAWGDNSSGQCEVPEGYLFYSIAAGRHHSLAIRDNGFLAAWGSNSEGQCEVPEYNFTYGIIAAGQAHCFANMMPGWEPPAFTANLTVDNLVELTWVTESEWGMQGYNIYRNDNNILSDAVRINENLIAATNTSEQYTYSFLDSNVENGHWYFYWLEWVFSDTVSAFYGHSIVVIPDQPMPPPFPTESEIDIPYPNPVRKGSNPHFRIAIKGGEKGTLTICNAKGQVMQTYHLIAGHHYLTWESSGYGSGIYFYQLVTPSVKIGGKLVIIY